jgi:FKBP-type peptidyl-prolyl cis-trans isomerase FklB
MALIPGSGHGEVNPALVTGLVLVLLLPLTRAFSVMKTHALLSRGLLFAALPLAFIACQKEPAASTPVAEAAPPAEPEPMEELVLETLDQRASYAIGQKIATQISADPNLTVDADALIAGIGDKLAGKDPYLNEQEVVAVFNDLRSRAQKAERAAIAAEQAKAAEFLDANARRPEVVSTGSGLQYEVITEGTGPKPTPENRVKVHYHGTLTDGTVFDSSVQRGDPIEFPVTGVIPGWVEALQLMPTGSKWRLFIPPALGYGDRGSGKIPGGAALIFEVELIEVK